MNIKNYLLVTALMFSPLMTQPADVPNAPETEIVEPKEDTTLSAHLPPLIIGGLIGCTTGALFTNAVSFGMRHFDIDSKKIKNSFYYKYFDINQSAMITLNKQVWTYLIILVVIEIYTRKTIIDVIEDIFNKCKITNNRKLMATTAWLASWAASLIE